MVIKWILFDCDNTLVQSENVILKAIATTLNAQLALNGIDHRYTPEELKEQHRDLTARGMAVKMMMRFRFRLRKYELRDVAADVEDQVIAKLKEGAEPCPGVLEVLAKLHEEDEYTLAAVSCSSSKACLEAALSNSGLDQFFLAKDRFSALSIATTTPVTKPDSAIYRHILDKYDAKPHECMVIQDTVVGASAAVRARIPVMGYVGGCATDEEKHAAILELAMAGCKSVMWDWSDFDKEFERLQEQIKK
ncbi:hypothetical protein A1O1_03767 [Capronia coronata CBS 617.96]|uniref:Phosphoglycolate phosphatase n=1 Tax=Capronia coronata CBS 617.96 TaxID=1182541 RepID=W9YDP5_9EURO|nr:uncharacterized protein A1O1_03767 [Capronia coronata CBS 617.96]EXJ90663.1 hypothetical protein A1O1_03767 [Capronia coronata CBS 617.96]